MSAPIYGPPPVTHWDFDYDQVDYWSDPNYSPPFPDYVMQYWDPMNYTPPRRTVRSPGQAGPRGAVGSSGGGIAGA